MRLFINLIKISQFTKEIITVTLIGTAHTIINYDTIEDAFLNSKILYNALRPRYFLCSSK